MAATCHGILRRRSGIGLVLLYSSKTELTEANTHPDAAEIRSLLSKLATTKLGHLGSLLLGDQKKALRQSIDNTGGTRPRPW
jgi:hypothetical protein